MSAFAWPQSDLACAATCLSGALCIAYGLVEIFLPRVRYLNTANACVLCLLALSLDASSVACANSVMAAAVIFGASLLSSPGGAPRCQLGPPGNQANHGFPAWATDGSNASRTGRPCSPGGAA
jgi:hypothetical protein